MDFANIATLLSQFGFPTACCVAMFWFISKQESRHSDEIDAMTKALNNNTQVVAQMSTKLDTIILTTMHTKGD